MVLPSLLRQPAAITPELEEMVRTMKLRSTATGVSSVPKHKDFLSWLDDLRQPTGSSSSSIADRDVLPIEDGKIDSQSVPSDGETLASGAPPAKLDESTAIALVKLKTDEKQTLTKKTSVEQSLKELKTAYRAPARQVTRKQLLLRQNCQRKGKALKIASSLIPRRTTPR